MAASIVAQRFEKLLVNWLRRLGLSNVQVGFNAEGGQGNVVLGLQLWHKVCQSLSKIFRCVVTRKANHCDLSFHGFGIHDMRVHDLALVEGEVDEVENEGDDGEEVVHLPLLQDLLQAGHAGGNGCKLGK